MNNIRNVDDYVSQSPFKDINTIKGIKPDLDEKSRNIAGQEGKVTIATSAAGRGVDIKLSKISLKKGGLHVIIPFLMPNQRALEQAAGRCGRQGQPGSVNIYYSKKDFYLMSKAFDIKEHNLWLIQNILVEYLHKQYTFLFEGKGKYRIPDIELPCCIQISDAFMLCLSIISKSEGSSEENKEKYLDYLMDMIKITWGLYFNDLTNDDQCENFEYCKKKLFEYLNYLNQNFQKIIIEQNQKKTINYKYISSLAFDTLRFAAKLIKNPLLSVLVFGGIKIGEEIFNALYNNEKINWGKVFLKFGEGCVEGLSFDFKFGKALQKIIVPSLFEYAEAKIDGKDYNLIQGIGKKTFNEAVKKVSKFKKIVIKGKTKDLLNGASFDDKSVKNIKEKIYNNKDKFILKNLKNDIIDYLNKLEDNIEEKTTKIQLYYLLGMFDEALGDAILGPSEVEKDLFDELDDCIKKTNKSFISEKIKKKIDKISSKKTSNKDDIIDGLLDLNDSKK